MPKYFMEFSIFAFAYSSTIFKMFSLPVWCHSKSETTLSSKKLVTWEDLSLGARAPSPWPLCPCLDYYVRNVTKSSCEPHDIKAHYLLLPSSSVRPSITALGKLLFFHLPFSIPMTHTKLWGHKFEVSTILTTWRFLHGSFPVSPKVNILP